MGKGRRRRQQVSSAQLQTEIGRLNTQIAPLGLKIRDVPGDGNCLFRSAADQMYDSSSKHMAVREEALRFVDDNAEMFAPFVEDDESFEEYVTRMQQDSEWGGNIEIQAMSLFYSADVVIHMLDAPRMEVRNPGSTQVWSGVRALHCVVQNHLPPMAHVLWQCLSCYLGLWEMWLQSVLFHNKTARPTT